MITFKRLITFIVPSSILGLSWFWWRWRSKPLLLKAIDSNTVDNCDTTDAVSNDDASNDTHNTIPINADTDLCSIENCDTDVSAINMNKEEVKDLGSNCCRNIHIETVKLVQTEEPKSVVNEETIKSVKTDDSSASPSVGEINGEDNKFTEPINDNDDCNNIISENMEDNTDYNIYENVEDRPNYNCEEIEDEISLLMINQDECEVLPSDTISNNERSHSIISQLSIDCVQEGLGCEEFSPVNYNASTFTTGKRIRNRSSCGDSAICEDYSSDALSITGSDSAIKSSESEVCAMESKTLIEEQRFKKGLENGRSYRDWYGPSIGSTDFKERPEKSRHWGSVPVTDSDSDSECILKRTAKIGSVSLDKLSIQLNEELSKVYSSSDRTMSSKSTRYPKQGRRRSRKSESRPPKKPLPAKQSSQPKRNDSNRRQRRKSSSSSPKKDIDKPWRSQETGKKYEKVVADENAKRVTVEYEFPDDMCGRLIGKSGRHISEFKESSGVDICIECELHGKNRIVSMTGAPSRIKNAEKLLNEKFHDCLKRVNHPDMSEVEKNISPTALPDDSEVNVIVTAIVDVASFYVQVFNRDVEERLMQLQADLYGCYVTPRPKYIYTEKELPAVDEFCVSFVDNVWCRLKVLHVYAETRMVDAFFIDYGGNINISVDFIWKARPDLLQTPAQAVLCRLHNAVPVAGTTEFSYEANDIFYQMVGEKVLQALLLSVKDEIPHIQLSYFDEERGEMFSVIEQMQIWGLARDESIPHITESIHDESISQVALPRVENTFKYTLHLQEDSPPQFVESILNGSAPQFICAS